MKILIIAGLFVISVSTQAQNYSGLFYSPHTEGMHTDNWFNLLPNSGATIANSWNIYHKDGGSIFSAGYGAVQPYVHIGSSKTTNLLINGNLGVGTSNPLNGLHLFKSGDFAAGSVRFGFSGSNDGVISMGWNPATLGDAIKFSYFAHNATSGQVDLMTLSLNGNVGIGTANPKQKLTVNGTIYGKEVKVDLSVPGPDYVFEKSYALASLDSVQSYINQNKHLPEVPSAKEMEADGVKLGEMNMLLLKKVEELTLYVIELKKENELQNRSIQQLIKNK